jgi:hypothetical protein
LDGRLPGNVLFVGSLLVAVGNSVWELLGIAFIVLVPIVPVTYLAWSFLGGRRRGEDIESGRSPATPFAMISIVGSAITATALLMLLLVVAIRAIAA